MAFGRLRRFLPPIALFAGLFFFGVSLLVLGTGALENDATEYDATSLTVTNGTALLLYSTEYYGYQRAHINVTYAFPQAPGDAFFVGCNDAVRMRGGGEPQAPILAFENLRAGRFVVSDQTAAYDESLYVRDARACAAFVAFRWAAPGDDPAPNRPEVSAVYAAPRLDSENLGFLLGLMVISATLALLGGLAWARARTAREPAAPTDDSTVEALRRSLDRMGEQLERTRRHLLFAGVLGIFLWYPILVPWAWQQAARVSDDAFLPWTVAGAALAFLIVLTILWAREFLRLDRELNAWRGRLGELRDREAGLLDDLESGGG